MDSVRFGRALGIGARAAAKTLVTAVDAATAPNPSAAKPKSAQASTPAQIPAATAKPIPPAPDTRTAQRPNPATRTAQARQTGQGLARGSKLFAQAVWKPFVKLSGVLWLELAGVFFGVFAFFGAGWAWKSRTAIHETATNHDAHVQFLVCAAMAIVFGYFLVSSFVRARRRGRGQ